MKGLSFRVLQLWAALGAFVILDNAVLGGEIMAELKYRTAHYAIQVEFTATDLWGRLWARA